MTDIALQVSNVSFRYDALTALDAVSFDVVAGGVAAILGPNGSGKSTLFRLIATLAPPSAGSIRVCGIDAATDPRAVRRLLGVVFQSPGLDKKLTARENLVFHGELCGMPRADLQARADALLSAQGLGERSNERVERYSGGMARRVEIAKAMLTQPRLLLLDEPGTGLDPAARREMWRQLRDHRDRHGVTIVLTTHDMAEADMADQVIILADGRLAAQGAPQDLKSRVGGDVIRVTAADAASLLTDVRARFGEAAIVDGEIRMERAQGHTFVPTLIEAFAGRISSVAVGGPTLDDVFIQVAGRRLVGTGDKP